MRDSGPRSRRRSWIESAAVVDGVRTSRRDLAGITDAPLGLEKVSGALVAVNMPSANCPTAGVTALNEKISILYLRLNKQSALCRKDRFMAKSASTDDRLAASSSVPAFRGVPGVIPLVLVRTNDKISASEALDASSVWPRDGAGAARRRC